MMRRPSPLRHPRGFSLVELLVGIVVAMAAVIVVMQVFKASEGQRRNTAGGDDAQATGAVALSMMQRDLRQAGQGFTHQDLLGCQLNLGNSRNLPVLAPIIINPGGIPDADENTDVLLVGYGSGWGAPEGTRIVSQTGAATYSVGAPQAYRLGDRLIATPGNRNTPCLLVMTDLAAAPTGNAVTVNFGIAGAANGTLFNLGLTPRFLVYAVRSSRLTVCDFMTQDCTSNDPDNWTEVADNIVSLRAEYALDTTVPRDATLDTYSQTAPSTVRPWCDWSRTIGVRLAIVARSRQPETTDVTNTAPTWGGTATTPITLNAADWKLYRYKTFETTVPLRNTPLAGAVVFSAC